MRRRILAVSALLVVLVACRDGPAELTTPVEAPMAPQPDVTVSADAVQTVVDLLDDPLVRELQGAIGFATVLLDAAVRDASRYGTPDDIAALSRALTDTRRRLVPSEDDAEEDADEVILRAALVLMLDDALMLLEEPTMRSEETEELGTDDTNARIIKQ